MSGTIAFDVVVCAASRYSWASLSVHRGIRFVAVRRFVLSCLLRFGNAFRRHEGQLIIFAQIFLNFDEVPGASKHQITVAWISPSTCIKNYQEKTMKIAASIALLFVVGISLAFGSNYANPSDSAAASKVCACASCCPGGGCCCESGVCLCEKCTCECCSDGMKDCGANCCAEKAEVSETVSVDAKCSKGCCKK